MVSTKSADARIAERNAWVFARRLEGHSIRAIAAMATEHFGRDLSPTRVHDILTEEIVAHKRYAMRAADELRAIADAKLDKLELLVQSVLDNPPPLVMDGEIIKDADGNTVPLQAAILPAVDRALKIEDRRARLHGLDAPVQVVQDVTVAYTVNGVPVEALT